MPKIFVKTQDPSIIPKLNRFKKPGYELIPVSVDAPLDMLSPETNDIHGVMVDCDLITSEEVAEIRETMKSGTFPVFLLTKGLGDEEAGKWLRCGASDIFQVNMPPALIGLRIGMTVKLYCVEKSLFGQVTDELTGLYNKEAFYHFAKEMMLKNPEDDYVVILSDIENFKGINERFGEEKGDALLRYVGKVLGTFNNEDLLFARYSGDQFVGIMRKPDKLMEVNEDFVREGMRVSFSDAPIDHFRVQFGVYEDVDKSLPVSIMCDRALMALKTIKHRYGRIMARYTAQLQQRLSREQQILDSMEQAITEKQFEIYYQPKHDTKTSEIIGAEALVRWHHPEFGFLSPAEFIPLFERNGFIPKLDEYVWSEVCRELRGMMDAGIPVVPVSVNASRMDFLSEGFAEKLKKPLEQYSIDPGYLHLEVTEIVYMENSDVMAPIIRKIKAFGIEIELDDFGSGFSSLGNISSLPVDIIKLDISLIRNLETQPIIVDGLVHMMHSLGYKVIAEGVENDSQVEILRKMDCNYIQGYYFSKPLTLEGFCNYTELEKSK